MYINAKMVPVKTIPGIGEGDKTGGEEGEPKYDVFNTL
jgi:hypothetical protein